MAPAINTAKIYIKVQQALGSIELCLIIQLRGKDKQTLVTG